MKPSRPRAHCAAAMSMRTMLPSMALRGPFVRQQRADLQRTRGFADVEPDVVADRDAVAARRSSP